MAKEKFDFKEIENIDWKYLVNRKENLFFRSITENSYKYFQKITGIPWKMNYMIRLGNGDIYFSKKELDELHLFFSAKSCKRFLDFKDTLIFNIELLDKTARGIEKTNFKKLSKIQLIKIFNQYIKITSYSHLFLTPIPIADIVLSKVILGMLSKESEQKKQEWLNILTFPIKENKHTNEERSFYNLVINYKQKNNKINLLIKKHLDKFGWIGARGFCWGSEWREKDILERINYFLKQNKNPEKEIEHLYNLREKSKKEAKELFKKLKIKKSSTLYKLIFLAKEYAYLRTWRTDIIYRSGYRVKNFFYEIAERAEFNKNNIVYLTYFEMYKMLETGRHPISEKEINKRKRCFMVIFIKNKFIVLSGEKCNEKLKLISSTVKLEQKIKGNIAFKGKVSGIVKIVYLVKDIKKVEIGDVLVAVMTFPNFIPAMEKASAFVTDEGGILCHAVIVAREMQKHCIIGTKIATQVLRDGDLVEVDAEQGVVKILKKNKT